MNTVKTRFYSALKKLKSYLEKKMSCPKTPHLLKEYFSDNLSVIAREEIEAHVASCDDCRAN